MRLACLSLGTYSETDVAAYVGSDVGADVRTNGGANIGADGGADVRMDGGENGDDEKPPSGRTCPSDFVMHNEVNIPECSTMEFVYCDNSLFTVIISFWLAYIVYTYIATKT